jgi:hypothetical protein
MRFWPESFSKTPPLHCWFDVLVVVGLITSLLLLGAASR